MWKGKGIGGPKMIWGERGGGRKGPPDFKSGARPEPARLCGVHGRTKTQTDMPHRFLTKGENQSNGEQIAFLTNAARHPETKN